MKTALSRTWTATARLFWWFQVRSLEITVHGQTEALNMVGDPLLSARIQVARAETRRELARARAEYNARLPVGRRVTWRMA